MQIFTVISPSANLSDSLTPLQDNDITALSNSEGTSFPTTNLYLGMNCYRSDLNKEYKLTATSPAAVWTQGIDFNKTVVETDGSGNATISGTFTMAALSATGNVTVGGNLAVTGIASFNGAANFTMAANIAAASTVAIGAATGNAMNVTGNTAITAFDTISAGAIRYLRFTGTPLLTYDATKMILPGAASIQVQAGDMAEVVSLGAGNWIVSRYQRATGQSLSITGARASLAAATTTDLGSTGVNLIGITASGNPTIVSFGSSAIAGNPIYFVRFLNPCILQYNSSSLLLPGGVNINAKTGDAGLFEYLGAGNWQCHAYMPANGQALSITGPEQSIAGATTTDIGSITGNAAVITGTGTNITSFGSSATLSDPLYFVRFGGAQTLKFNGTSMILPGGLDINTGLGDASIWQYLGSGNWQCVSYTKANGSAVITPTLNDSFSNNLFHVAEQQATNVGSADVIFAGAWTLRTLNTSYVNQITGAVLSSNTIQLPAGTYILEAEVPAAVSGLYTVPIVVKARLRNTTDSHTTLVSVPDYKLTNNIKGGGGSEVIKQRIFGRFTIAATKVFQIEQWVADNSGNVILNDAVPTPFYAVDGEINIFTNVQIWKVG